MLYRRRQISQLITIMLQTKVLQFEILLAQLRKNVTNKIYGGYAVMMFLYTIDHMG